MTDWFQKFPIPPKTQKRRENLQPDSPNVWHYIQPRGIIQKIRHWTPLSDEDRIPQRFWGHFMRQQLDTITACNEHGPFIGPFQYGGTVYLSKGNLMVRNTVSGRDPLEIHQEKAHRSWRVLIGKNQQGVYDPVTNSIWKISLTTHQHRTKRIQTFLHSPTTTSPTNAYGRLDRKKKENKRRKRQETIGTEIKHSASLSHLHTRPKA